MKNKVKFGLSNVHLFPITEESRESITYGPVIKVPGAVTLTLDVEEMPLKFYADNQVYYSNYNLSGYGGSLEIAMVTDELREKVYNQKKDTSGVWHENKDDKTTAFGMAYQVEGDQAATRYQFMRVTAGKPSMNAQTTTENVEPLTDTLNITVTPRLHDSIIKAYVEEGEAAYEEFFTKMNEGPATV